MHAYLEIHHMTKEISNVFNKLNLKYEYSKTRLQWISGDTGENFVIAVIRYINIAKFVILYNKFFLRTENKAGTMNSCWTLYIQNCKHVTMNAGTCGM